MELFDTISSDGKNENRTSKSVVHPWRNAVLIGASYIILAGAYIIISTQYVASHATSVASVQLSELQKGLIFVVTTGTLLAFFIGLLLKRLAGKEEKIIDQRNALIIAERHAIAGMLASSIAHDINNVLTILENNVSFLSRETEKNPTIKKHLNRVYDANEQLKQLANRLTFAGKTYALENVESFDLGATMIKALELSKTHRDVRHCDIQFSCPARLSMKGYPDLIQQMFVNLVLNAAQATEGAGEIHIRVEQQNHYVQVVVEDNGSGIPESKRQKVFEPFYSTKDMGTGLGMLSIQACVESHNGNVDISDSHLGGAKLVVNLPVHSKVKNAV